MRAALFAIAMTISGSTAASIEPREALPDAELPVVSAHAWLSSPINLWDIGLEGTRKHDVIGTINGREVHMNELDQQSVGAFGAIAQRIFDARDRAMTWLVERRAIERAGGMRALHRLEAHSFHTFAIARSVLVRRTAIAFDRLQVNIFEPSYASSNVILAKLDGVSFDRAMIDRYAGSTLQLARREYYTLLVNQWDKLVTRTLREGHVVSEVPAATPNELAALYAEQPAYQSDPERARALIVGRKRDALEKALDVKLRSEAKIELLVKEPAIEPIATDGAVAPITIGAGPPVVLFQPFGCGRCGAATKRAQALAATHTVTIVDFVAPEEPASIVGAMAVRCAYNKAWPMAQVLADDPGSADIESLAARASRAGADVVRFRVCMREERFMPEVVENTKLAARVLPEPPAMAIPFFYRDGLLLP